MTKPAIFKILLISFLTIVSAEEVFAQASVTINGDERIETLMELKKELEKENKLVIQKI